MIEQLRELLRSQVVVEPVVLGNLVASLAAIVVLWLARRFVLSVAFSRIDHHAHRYRWRKTSTAITVLLGAVVIGRIWFEAVGSVATVLALISAGLAIALKDPLTDMAGWIFIVWRRPFSVGDRIEIGNVAGDVIDLRLFQFTVLEIGNWVAADQSTGRLVHIPNARVFTEPQANFTQGFAYIWNELPVLVTFESDWRKAKELLREIVSRHGRAGVATGRGGGSACRGTLPDPLRNPHPDGLHVGPGLGRPAHHPPPMQPAAAAGRQRGDLGGDPRRLRAQRRHRLRLPDPALLRQRFGGQAAASPRRRQVRRPRHRQIGARSAPSTRSNGA